MLTKIIRKERRVLKSGKVSFVNVYLCKSCDKELFMNKFNASKHKGICLECIIKKTEVYNI